MSGDILASRTSGAIVLPKATMSGGKFSRSGESLSWSAAHW
jgi:hypothetical protein